MPELPKVDEFAFVLMAGVLLIFILAFAWTTPSEAPPIVDEAHFEVTTVQGETKAIDFRIRGTTSLTSINITKSGDIANWITLNKNDFDVASGASTTVTATIKVPGSATMGTHSGRITLTSKGGSDTFSISVIVVKERTKTSEKAISLGNFAVSYTKGKDILDSREDVSVSSSLLSERFITLSGSITLEKLSIVTNAAVRLSIKDTNQEGNLIVAVDGTEVYNKKIGTGEILIPVQKELLETSNMVTIRAGSPGWKFWTSAFYDIKEAEFVIDYEGAFTKTFNFTMTKNEVDNFKQFNLFYRVPPEGYAVPLTELMIKVNSQIVYWDVPPLALFDKPFKEDMFGKPLYLNEGTNTITFEFEKEAFYKISDTMLTTEYYV